MEGCIVNLFKFVNLILKKFVPAFRVQEQFTEEVCLSEDESYLNIVITKRHRLDH